MKKLLDMLGDADARTALIALSATLGAVVYLGLAVASFARGHVAFDGNEFAVGWAGVLGASAAAIAGHAWGQAKADAIPSASASVAAPAAPTGASS